MKKKLTSGASESKVHRIQLQLANKLEQSPLQSINKSSLHKQQSTDLDEKLTELRRRTAR
jgi:hypothetical protein